VILSIIKQNHPFSMKIGILSTTPSCGAAAPQESVSLFF